MKNRKKKIISNLLIVLIIISIGTSVYAHSGRTDSNGGHRDNKNKSGLGNYHYHCGGYPAHLHSNGVCPYSSSSSSSKSSTSNSLSATTETTAVPTTIDVSDIKINENISNMEEGEKQQLTITIMPEDATDKNITWKSSNENIATINVLGEVTAQKYGTVNITATSSNGKTSTIRINIIKKTKENNDNMSNTTVDNNNNAIINKKSNSNPLAGMIAIGLLGGGYFGYKKFKNK